MGDNEPQFSLGDMFGLTKSPEQEQKEILRQPLIEAYDYIRAAVSLFETDPQTSSTLLMSASKKVQLYADRRAELSP